MAQPVYRKIGGFPMRNQQKIALKKSWILHTESVRCKIFLGFTSNLVSSGVRDIIRFLVEHRMVVLVAEVNGGSNLDLVPKSAILGETFRAFSNASLHKLRQRI